MGHEEYINTINLRDDLDRFLNTKKKTYQQHVNRISAMGDKCLKKLYHARVDWDKARPTDTGLQGVFETGNLLEADITRIIIEVGQSGTPRWRIVGTQVATKHPELDKHQISGTIDGFLQVQDVHVGDWVTIGVVDIKTMSGNIFPQINSVGDLQRYTWTARYPAQLMLYAYANNQKHCYILGVNKNNLYDMKLIDFPVDMDYVRKLFDRADIVNEAIAAKTPPEPLNDPVECPRCQFYSLCCPDFAHDGSTVISTDDDVIETLERMGDLKEAVTEYKKLERILKTQLIEGQNTAYGKFLVTWKEQIRNDKAREASVTKFWKKTIVRGNT